MIVLSTTSESLRIVLGGAATSNQVKCAVSWRDIASEAYAVQSLQASTNDTTPVELVAAPASNHQIKIDFVSLYNEDTVETASISLHILRGSDTFPVWGGTLGSGCALHYCDGQGFTKTDANGDLITNFLTA